MHNLKDIRKNFEAFKKALKNRASNIDFKKLIDLDKKNRELIQKKENFEREKKDISKSKNQKLFAKSKEISLSIEKINAQQKMIKEDLENILSNIPNIPYHDVPEGNDENDNVEISKSGDIPNFDFNPKSHFELGENLGMLDFDLATKTTGSRFVFVKNKLALLERAISNFMLDIHIKKNGYEEISPPLIASENTMFGTGQLPKFANDQFELKLEEGSGRKFLIPTAEVILTNIVKDKIIDLKSLPMRFVASTPCFRKRSWQLWKRYQRNDTTAPVLQS
tara:strand:+ start:81 stop:917 length:837 start_codon:yes stop_codon:yes gene_type:complete